MINSVVIQGRLARDPEIKTTQSGVAVANFTVCWSDRYKETETKLFVFCRAWRGTAEFIEKYFKKGQEIAVEGRLITEEWEKDGEKKSRVVLDVRGVHFCGKREDSQGAAAEPAESQPVQVEDDLPFDFSAERR